MATFTRRFKFENQRLAAVSLALLATASLYSDPSRAEDARVLPKGRSRFSLIYAQTGSISQTFDNEGKVISVTAPYNMEISAATLSKADPAAAKLVGVLNITGWHYNSAESSTSSHGLTKDDRYPLLGDALSLYLGSNADAHREQYMTSFQYGLTDRLSVGFMLPYVKTQVNINHGVSANNSIADLQSYFAGGNSKPDQDAADGLKKLNSVNSETFQAMLTDKGYSRVQNYNGGGLGDIILGGRYNYLNQERKTGNYISSFQAGVTLPTGHIKPPSELIEPDTGQGAWDLGVANIFNYSPASMVTFSNGTHYTYFFSDHRAMRVKKDASVLIPDASDEEMIKQRLGDKFSTNLGTKVSFSKAVNIEASYEWAWKARDSYEGSKADRDYGSLADQTDSYGETFNISLNLSTIPAFLKYDFPLPLDISFNVFVPTSGKNAVITPYGTAELAAYF